MKKLNKMLAVVLSLVLCATMVAPAFAASFSELQGVIDNKTSLKDGDNVRIDYTNGTVTLNESVIRGEDETNKSIIIDAADGQVIIDLNGKDINGNDEKSQHAVIEVKGGNLTIKDSTAHPDEETGEYVSGAVTGGNHVKVPGGASGHGAGVSVTEGGSLTIESGAIKGNHAEESGGGVYIANGSVTMNGGLIDDNYAGHSGGGVSVNAAAVASDTVSSFTMNNGTISNNESGQGGAGIYVNVYQTSPVDKKDVPVDRNYATLAGGAIKDNHTVTDGGGVFITNGTLNISGTEISGNTAGRNGAGMYIAGRSEATMTDGSVTGNEAGAAGGGLYLFNQAKFEMTGGEFHSNSATNMADDVFKRNGTTLKLSSAASMGVQGKDENGDNITKDGKDITGWYYDAGDRWGKKYTCQDGYAVNPDRSADKTLAMKAAHDQYFDVIFDLGYEGAESVTNSLEKGSNFPAAPTVPDRTGFTFNGWFDADGNEVDLESLPEKVTGNMTLTAQWRENPVIDDDPAPVDPGTEIDEPAVPLASGPVTRAEFLDYLWRHEGAPESDGVCTFADVPEDHEFILALAWAEQNGVASAYEDGTFEPDELVTVAAVREFLGNFAGVFGANAVAAADLASLSGDDDEAVLNCDEVLAEFFGEEYASAEEDEAA